MGHSWDLLPAQKSDRMEQQPAQPLLQLCCRAQELLSLGSPAPGAPVLPQGPGSSTFPVELCPKVSPQVGQRHRPRRVAPPRCQLAPGSADTRLSWRVPWSRTGAEHGISHLRGHLGSDISICRWSCSPQDTPAVSPGPGRCLTKTDEAKPCSQRGCSVLSSP